MTGHAYYCFCTKEELEERRAACEAKGEVFKYDKHCLHLTQEEIQRKLDAGVPYVIRQNAPTTGETSYDDLVFGHMTFPNDTLDDMVLIKQDGMPTYNFANVVDDHLMAMSHVMRGTEYLSSAPKYNLLYEAFGWKPPIYLHLPPVMIESVLKDKETKQPILDENGNEQPIVRKLSKRWGDPSFEDLLQKGYLKEAIINYIALLGWAPKDTNEEFFSMEDTPLTNRMVAPWFAGGAGTRTEAVAGSGRVVVEVGERVPDSGCVQGRRSLMRNHYERRKNPRP